MNLLLRKRLLQGDVNIYAVATGAAAGLQAALWEPPGASSYLVGASFPYASCEADAFLGYKPEGYCNQETALDLATEAYTRAKRANLKKPAIGLSVTASVASLMPHRGDHVINAAVVSDCGGGSFRLQHVLPKATGEFMRAQDDESATQIGQAALSAALGLAETGAQVSDAELLNAALKNPFFLPDGRRKKTDFKLEQPSVFFPGAFNPIHDGHRAIANAMFKSANQAIYMICLDQPHKPALNGIETWQRIAQFKNEWLHENGIACPLLLTKGDPLFVDKVKRNPGAKFVIGADTLERLLDSRWGVTPADVLREIKESGCTFLVTPCEYQNRTLNLDKVFAALAITQEMAPGFIPVNHFYIPNIRSSALREAG